MILADSQASGLGGECQRAERQGFNGSRNEPNGPTGDAAEPPKNRLQPNRRTTDCSRTAEQQTAAEPRTTDCSGTAEKQTAAEPPKNRLQQNSRKTGG